MPEFSICCPSTQVKWISQNLPICLFASYLNCGFLTEVRVWPGFISPYILFLFLLSYYLISYYLILFFLNILIGSLEFIVCICFKLYFVLWIRSFSSEMFSCCYIYICYIYIYIYIYICLFSLTRSLLNRKFDQEPCSREDLSSNRLHFRVKGKEPGCNRKRTRMPE